MLKKFQTWGGDKNPQLGNECLQTLYKAISISGLAAGVERAAQRFRADLGEGPVQVDDFGLGLGNQKVSHGQFSERVQVLRVLGLFYCSPCGCGEVFVHISAGSSTGLQSEFVMEGCGMVSVRAERK